MTRDPYAIWRPSPNYTVGRFGVDVSHFIVHGTSGGGPVTHMTTPGTFVSSTYCITRDVRADGTASLYQLVDEDDMHWSNGGVEDGCDPWWRDGINPNLKTISVEIEKPQGNTDPPTEAQYKTLIALAKRVCQRHNIPMRWADARGGITGHFSMQPQSRSMCPGTFDWNRFFREIQDEEENTMAVTWDSPNEKHYLQKIGDGKYKRKDGKGTVGGAIGRHFLALGGVAVCGLPIGDEYAPEGKEGARIQEFERIVIAYDPNRIIDNPPVDPKQTCYTMHITSGIVRWKIAKPLIDPLQKQIDDLTKRKNELDQMVKTLQARVKELETTDYAKELAEAQHQLSTALTERNALKSVLDNVKSLISTY